MRKISFVFVLLLILSPLISASLWDATSLNCNDYKYSAPISYENYTVAGADRQIYVCDSSNHVVAASPPNVWGQIQATNTNLKYTGGGGNWVSSWYRIGGDAPISLTMSNHIFYILWSTIDCGGSSCSALLNDSVCTQPIDPIYPPDYDGYTWKSDLIPFPIYSICPKPNLTIVNSTIQSDRYYFAFNVTNPNSLNWNCTFKALGVTGNYYEQKFAADTTIDLLFSTFPKQHTMGRITCWYQSSSTEVTLFKDFQWMIDTGIYYNIYDLDMTLGKATPSPPKLPPYSKLDYVNFYILSQIDKTKFTGNINVRVTSPSDLASLNCSAADGWNTTYNGQPPDSILGYYRYAVGITCNNPIDVPLTLTVWDASTGQQLDSASFNISWTVGDMTIDNINFVRGYNTTNKTDVQLWATISNEYTGTIINDYSNLTCNYSLTRNSDLANFTGNMTEYRTYSQGFLIQTDMFAVVDTDINTWNPDESASFSINCSAIDYNNKTVSTSRILALRRITTFRCKANYPDYTLHYSISNYYTDPTNVDCVIKFDTANISQDADSQLPIAWLLLQAPKATLQLQKNINWNGLNDPCSNMVNLAWSSLYSGFKVAGATSGNAIDEMHELDNICNIIPIDKTKVSNDLVKFSIQFPYLNYLYPETTAVLTFDIKHLQKPQLGTASLGIVNSKASNQGTVELNDTILCSVSAFDPNQQIDDVYFNFYNYIEGTPLQTILSGLVQQCQGGTETLFNITNSSYKTYYASVQVTPSSCGFMSIPNQKGKIICSAIAVYFGTGNDVKWSNAMNWITHEIPKGGGGYTSKLNISINNTCLSAISYPSEEAYTKCKDDLFKSFVNFVINNLVEFAVIIFMLILLEPYLVKLFQWGLELIMKSINEKGED